ncbi:predicted protein [Phaeodactylum tricornutum CCAP 1055/1]|uniref:Uncharacterized protein n=1 Tax=Phaeodactylum tricornutum (strain CCAP 1055/1) TaxID=556484 RepID=B7GCK4_PHATC|nr:predicted protein [Phaeodactylum tricornutum CCAP 1055/1]EEC43623.1 predicted protein [Phaeodactylum tricornutum CCAP 1055/1]|eukprot:XP_002184887.1 predicted protein [Phaeodactylum tricornutum CCAP 1055/1]
MTKRKIPQHRTFGDHSFWDTHCQSYPVFRRRDAVPDPVRLSSDSAIGVTDSVVANTVPVNPYRRIRPESIPAQRRAGDGSSDSCTSREHRREPSQNKTQAVNARLSKASLSRTGRSAPTSIPPSAESRDTGMKKPFPGTAYPSEQSSPTQSVQALFVHSESIPSNSSPRLLHSNGPQY